MLQDDMLDAAPASLLPALKSPANIHGVTTKKHALNEIPASDSRIDFVGRWDESRTAKWAGSTCRFKFTGPLLFLKPGPDTRSSNLSNIGWCVDGKSYVAEARPNVSLRLWPPEGNQTPPRTPISSSSNGPLPSPPFFDQSEEPKLIEIALIDWGSVLQITSIQTMGDHDIYPAVPEEEKEHTPTMLFVGDSITSGFISDSDASQQPEEYCGFLDAYPAKVRQQLAPATRMYAIAYPGVKLVDAVEQAGMESLWFLGGPYSYSPEWDFAKDSGSSAPTHIFVNLGANDDAPSDTFLNTYAGFLDVLRETHGRRAGDIIVIAPFGCWSEKEQRYIGYYPKLKEKILQLKKDWSAVDAFSSGTLPSTPMLELAKFQLDSENPSLHGIADLVTPNHSPQQKRISSFSTTSTHSRQTSTASHIMSPRPSLYVRPSSIAAVSPQSHGTKARLHFVDTTGWLNARDDTFDGEHPTRQGAVKIAKKLKHFMANEGLLD